MKLSAFHRSYPQVSDRQMCALEYLIARSKDAEGVSKQVVIYMLRQSNNLSQPCALWVPDSCEMLEPVWKGLSKMMSSSCATHLDQIFEAMNSALHLQLHVGKL